MILQRCVHHATILTMIWQRWVHKASISTVIWQHEVHKATVLTRISQCCVCKAAVVNMMLRRWLQKTQCLESTCSTHVYNDLCIYDYVCLQVSISALFNVSLSLCTALCIWNRYFQQFVRSKNRFGVYTTSSYLLRIFFIFLSYFFHIFFVFSANCVFSYAQYRMDFPNLM